MSGWSRLGTRLLGPYLAQRVRRRAAPGDRVFLPVERLIYRAGRIDPEREQRWTVYAFSLLAFSAVSVLVLYVLQRLQGELPFNPTDVAAVPPALAFNTAVSFVTNTNWQNYAGESTMSHLTQMVGLTVQNFVSAAVGHGGHGRADPRPRATPLGRRSATSGSTSTRTTLRILLPLAFVFALLLVSQGVIQNLHGFDARDDRRGRDAGDPRRPGREPGGDQGARDERRRVLQRELGAPVREPDRRSRTWSSSSRSC